MTESEPDVTVSTQSVARSTATSQLKSQWDSGWWWSTLVALLHTSTLLTYKLDNVCPLFLW